MISIGIDPGLSGAVAVIHNNEIDLYDTPTITLPKGKGKKREFDEKEMANIIRPYICMDINIIVILEKAQAMKGQGVTSMFSTGLGYGIWRGILGTLQAPYRIVHPKTWQKAMGFVVGNPKQQSYHIASKLFPTAELRTKRGKILDGRCDAILMAEFGRRIRI
jgi:hypothetical protein